MRSTFHRNGQDMQVYRSGKYGFFFWRAVCQRELTPKDINEILENRETKGKVKLKKDGKTFEAKLHLESNEKFTLKC